MSKKIVNEETGQEEVVYTQAELDVIKADADKKMADAEAAATAKIKENEDHLKQKTDEFLKGKNAQELKDIERDKKIEEAKAAADAAGAKAVEAEQKRQDAVRASIVRQYVGEDPKLKERFEESWKMVNLEIKTDDDILKKAELAANMAGLNGTGMSSAGGMPMSGGFAPNMKPADKEKKEAEYSTFKNAFGLNEFIPKKEDDKK